MSRDKLGRFKTGNIGGPGRPRGSRNLLSEEFLADVYSDWMKNGRAALAVVRTNNPACYVRVVASLLPKDVHVQRSTLSEFEGLTDIQLVELLQVEARALLKERSDESEKIVGVWFQ